ncbi:unnamed protein product [Symbiodinium natans]|uniref:SET domain-containing protein n=1 Tax=Symbiodinium natans TaxID=878477 RepID=A0A812T507_9DINO|nr:unnamed protein product [Symbiodinium natans]
MAQRYSEFVPSTFAPPTALLEAPEDLGGQSPSRPSAPRDDLLQQWISPGATLYVNPICSQMDQMLLKCEEIESVLALLVTHRGVFFVHNLVTAIQVLASLAEDTKDPMEVNRLLRDPRYDVLLRDLFHFVPKLDFLAMTNVACSLQQLDHKCVAVLSHSPVQLHAIAGTGALCLLKSRAALRGRRTLQRDCLGKQPLAIVAADTAESEAGRGRRLLAAEDLPSGTEILAEDPVIQVSGEMGMDAVARELLDLDPVMQESLLELCQSSPLPADELASIEDISGDDDRLLALLRVFLINSLLVVLKVSKTGHLRLVTLRPVECKDEILVSYLPEGALLRPQSVRRRLLERWGFDCGCGRCQTPDDVRILVSTGQARVGWRTSWAQTAPVVAVHIRSREPGEDNDDWPTDETPPQDLLASLTKCIEQAVQLEFGDVKGWDVYLAATTQKAHKVAADHLKSSPNLRRILSLPKIEHNRRTGAGSVDAMAEALLISRADIFIRFVATLAPRDSAIGPDLSGDTWEMGP